MLTGVTGTKLDSVFLPGASQAPRSEASRVLGNRQGKLTFNEFQGG